MEERQSTCVLTNKEMKEAQKEGIDIICLVGKPSDEKLGDQFLLVGRGLHISKLPRKVEFNCNALFKALKDKYPGMGMNQEDLADQLESAGMTNIFSIS